MRNTLAMGMIFVLVLGLTACGRGEPLELYENGTPGLEVIEREPPSLLSEPPQAEPEPTHTTYTIHGLTLEMPIDWQAFRHPTYDQIWIHPPSDTPRRRDQTRITIFSEPIGERGYDLRNWFAEGNWEIPPLTELGGVEAYCGRIRGRLGVDNLGVQSLMPCDAIQRNFFLFNSGRFYDIRFMCADGEHWETLEQIRDSMQFSNGSN